MSLPQTAVDFFEMEFSLPTQTEEKNLPVNLVAKDLLRISSSVSNTSAFIHITPANINSIEINATAIDLQTMKCIHASFPNAKKLIINNLTPNDKIPPVVPVQLLSIPSSITKLEINLEPPNPPICNFKEAILSPTVESVIFKGPIFNFNTFPGPKNWIAKRNFVFINYEEKDGSCDLLLRCLRQPSISCGFFHIILSSSRHIDFGLFYSTVQLKPNKCLLLGDLSRTESIPSSIWYDAMKIPDLVYQRMFDIPELIFPSESASIIFVRLITKMPRNLNVPITSLRHLDLCIPSPTKDYNPSVFFLFAVETVLMKQHLIDHMCFFINPSVDEGICIHLFLFVLRHLIGNSVMLANQTHIPNAMKLRLFPKVSGNYRSSMRLIKDSFFSILKYVDMKTGEREVTFWKELNHPHPDFLELQRIVHSYIPFSPSSIDKPIHECLSMCATYTTTRSPALIDSIREKIEYLNSATLYHRPVEVKYQSRESKEQLSFTISNGDNSQQKLHISLYHTKF